MDDCMVETAKNTNYDTVFLGEKKIIEISQKYAFHYKRISISSCQSNLMMLKEKV